MRRQRRRRPRSVIMDADCDISNQSPPPVCQESTSEKLMEYKWALRKSVTVDCTDKSIPILLNHQALRGERFRPELRAHIGCQFLPNSTTWYMNFRHKVFCGFFDQSGERFISAGQDRLIKVFDVTSDYEIKYEILGRDVGWSILDIALSPDGQKLVYSSWSKRLHLVDLGHGPRDNAFHRSLELTNLHDEEQCGVFSLQFAGDGKRIFCGLNYGDVYIYDIEAQRCADRMDGGHVNSDINAVSIMDQSGNVFLTGADDCLIKVWDSRVLGQGPIGTFAGHEDGIVFIDSKGDFRYFISNSKDQTIKLWDFRRFSQPDQRWRPNRRAQWDYRWHLVPHEYSKPQMMSEDVSLATFRGHSVRYTLIRSRFSPSHSTGQRYIYSGSGDGSWCVWDTLTGELMTKNKGHNGAIRDIHWHPWDTTLITSGFDGAVKHWTYSASSVQPVKRRYRYLQRGESSSDSDDEVYGME